MAFPASQYIEERDGGLRIAGTRVSLSSVVVHFREGRTPERIVESFPTMSLAKAYGAIAFYLDNRELVDEYIAECERELERTVPPLSQSNPELFARLQAARERMASKR